MQRLKTICFVFFIIVFMLFSAACGTIIRRLAPQRPYQYEMPLPEERPSPVREQAHGGTIARAAERMNPSVVGISTLAAEQRPNFQGTQTISGVGSGVIVHESGFILTNDHVVGNAHRITVILQNGDELAGEVLWSDPTLDLAMIKINGTQLPAATLGDSRGLVVGEPAIAIGTPLGLQFQHTVTAGIISALNRTVQVPTGRGENFMEDLIQTDASINPGNSGGPLLNLDGQVIGINTVKVISAEGIGFAIPIDVAKPIIGHFIERGTYETPYIGIVGFDREIAGYLKQRNVQTEGVYVINIDPRGPGYHSGIRVDDIILQAGGRRVTKMLELRMAVYAHQVGDIIEVTVLRGGREHIFQMTLARQPAELRRF